MKTDKLLHLVQQKKAMRSGGALPLPKAQTGIKTTDPADPALHAYLDSLNLHNAYLQQLKYNPPRGSQPKKGEYKKSDLAKYFDPSDAKDYWTSEAQFKKDVPREANLIDAYKKLTFSTPTTTALWTSPDLYNERIAPVNIYFGGHPEDIFAHKNPVFAKPKVPIEYVGDSADYMKYRSKPTIVGTSYKFKPEASLKKPSNKSKIDTPLMQLRGMSPVEIDMEELTLRLPDDSRGSILSKDFPSGTFYYYKDSKGNIRPIEESTYGQLMQQGVPEYKEGGLPKAQVGIGKRVMLTAHPKPTLEEQINRELGSPMRKAAEAAKGEEWFNSVTGKWEKEDPVDNLRHAMAGRYTAEAIANKFPALMQYTPIPKTAGFLGANILGAAHEAKSINNRPSYSWWDKTREAGEDIINNFVGATIGSLPISDEQKTKILFEASRRNLLPDGYGKGNMYFKEKGGLAKAQAGTAYVESLCGPGYIESVDESGNKICVDPSTQPQRPDIGYQLRQQYKDQRPMVSAGYNGPYDGITKFYSSISTPLESNYSGYCPECEENQTRRRSFNFPNINLGNLFNNMFQGKPKYLRTPRAKKCKGPDCYKFQNAGVYDALLKYKESPDENKWEFLDPSGVTSWDDAARGYDSWQKSSQTFPTLDEGMDMFSAVPLFGKLGKVHKGIKMARASWKPAVNKLYELADYVREEKNKKSGGLAKAQLGPTVQAARQQALQKASLPQFDPRLVQAILASANQPVTNSLGRVISTPESRDKARREARIAKNPGTYSVSDYIAGIPEPGADNSVLSDPIAMAAMLTALPAAGATSLGTRFLSNLGDEVIFNTVAGMDPTGLTPTALSLGTRGNLTGRLVSAYDRAGRQAFNVNSNLGVLDALPENFNVRSKTARDQVAAKLAETGIFPRGETLTDIASAINNPNVNSPVVSYIRNNPELRRKLAYLTRDLNRDYNLDIDIASIRTPQELNTLYDRATQFLSSNSPIASNVRSLFTDADLQRLRSELNATTRSGQSSRVSIPTSSGSPIEMVRSGNDYVFESPASGARMTFNFDPDLNIASSFGFFNRANSTNARQARMDSGNMFRLATTNAPRNFCTTEGCLSSDSYPLLWSLGAADRPFRLLNPANYPRNQSRPWDMFTSMDERWKADAVANLTNRDLALLDQQSPNALGRYSPYAEVFGQPSVHNKEQLANFLNAQNSLYEISNDVLQSQLDRGLISPTMYDANIVKWLNDPANPNAGLSIKAPKLTEAEINLPLEQRQRFLPHQIPDDSKLRHPVFTRMALGPDMPNPLLSSDPVIRATQPGRGIYQYLVDPDAAINSSARIRFMQPIPVFQKMYGRGGLTAAKAREILHDKSVHGKPLTEKQRKFFGAIASGNKIRVKLKK